MSMLAAYNSDKQKDLHITHAYLVEWPVLGLPGDHQGGIARQLF
jgi:hypothetical protein